MALERQEVGRRIARRRAELGLTQEEASERAGVTLRAYQRWETGDAQPYWRNLQRLASAFGLEVEDLMGRDGAGARGDASDALERIEAKVDGLTARLDAVLRAVGLDGEALDEDQAAAVQAAQEAERATAARTRGSARSRGAT